MADSKKNPKRSHTLAKLPRTHKRQALRCKATRRDGMQCQGWAVKGGTVCRMHGGSAPQTINAARARLLAAADPLMAELISLAQNKKLDASVRLRAIADALDRAGLGARQAIDVTVQPWEQIIKDSVESEGGDGAVVIINGDDDLPALPHGEYVDPDDVESPASGLTSDSELRRRTSVDFEGTTHRPHRTQGARDDYPPPRPSAARRARNRRRYG